MPELTQALKARILAAVDDGYADQMVYVTGLSTLWAVPMMMLILTGNITNIAIGILVAIFLIGAYYAVLAPYLPRAFPIEMRYTGISLSFQLCGATVGGHTPWQHF